MSTQPIKSVAKSGPRRCARASTSMPRPQSRSTCSPTESADGGRRRTKSARPIWTAQSSSRTRRTLVRARHDGTECEIGKVIVWNPPARLVLAWQLDAEWKYDPDLITEVEITFTPEGDGTRVGLEHRDLERMGDGAQVKGEAIDDPGGWSGLLELYSQAAGR